jgi:molybdenum cofactor cytidylyltransferase
MRDEENDERGTRNDEAKTSSPSSAFSVPTSAFPPHPSSLRPHPSSVAAVVLAAGRSRRMGAFKPLLPFGRRTIIESCVESLRTGGAGEIVVVVGRRGGEVRAALSNLPVRLVWNEEDGSEMAASIARGVEALSGGASDVLVMPGDHPAVAPSVVRELIGVRVRGGARIVVPEWRGRGGHPVLVSLELRDELKRLGEAGGLRGLLRARASEVARLPVACAYVAREVDTWDDYAALHREVFGVPPPVRRPPAAP